MREQLVKLHDDAEKRGGHAADIHMQRHGEHAGKRHEDGGLKAHGNGAFLHRDQRETSEKHQAHAAEGKARHPRDRIRKARVSIAPHAEKAHSAHDGEQNGRHRDDGHQVAFFRTPHGNDARAAGNAEFGMRARAARRDARVDPRAALDLTLRRNARRFEHERRDHWQRDGHAHLDSRIEGASEYLHQHELREKRADDAPYRAGEQLRARKQQVVAHHQPKIARARHAQAECRQCVRIEKVLAIRKGETCRARSGKHRQSGREHLVGPPHDMRKRRE